MDYNEKDIIVEQLKHIKALELEIERLKSQKDVIRELLYKPTAHLLSTDKEDLLTHENNKGLSHNQINTINDIKHILEGK